MLALCSATTAFIVTPAFSTRATSHHANAVSMLSSSEAEAKAAWLAKLDAPAWGAAAKAINTITSEAAQFQALTVDCDAGIETACDQISKEEEAKKAWLAKLDVPVWGKVASAMEQVAIEQGGV